MPVLQAVGVDMPVDGQYEPAVQFKHTVEEVALRVEEYFPISQGVGEPMAEDAQYDPRVQAAQTEEPAGAYVPAEQGYCGEGRPSEPHAYPSGQSIGESASVSGQ